MDATEARRELYRAQCNCGYWHGLFGGLYLNYIRHAVYTHLIRAEAIVDRVLGREARHEVGRSDLDADLRDEIELSSPELCVYVKPDEGGGVYELDVRRKCMNLLNVLGRRREAYHEKLRLALEGGGAGEGGAEPKSIHDLVVVKDKTLGELLCYDRHLRMAFVDHFYPADVPLAELARGSYTELGDFAAGRYEVAGTGASAGAAWVTCAARARWAAPRSPSPSASPRRAASCRRATACRPRRASSSASAARSR